MEYVIGLIIAVLGFFGLSFFNKKSVDSDILDERHDELEEKIDEIEKKEKELAETGPEDLNPNEVVDYWKKD